MMDTVMEKGVDCMKEAVEKLMEEMRQVREAKEYFSVALRVVVRWCFCIEVRTDRNNSSVCSRTPSI